MKKFIAMLRAICVVCLSIALAQTTIFAHPGRTDSRGGHTNRKTGEYHYHNNGKDQNSSGSSGSSSTRQPYVKVNFPPKQLACGESFAPSVSSNSSDKSYSLKSSNESVIKVNGKMLEAVGGGTATIEVVTQDASESFQITVPDTYPKSIQVQVVNIAVGAAQIAAADISPLNITKNKITWQSDDPKIATISADGEITGIGAGQTKIRAVAENGVQGEAAVVVFEVLAEGITIETEDLRLEIDKSERILFKILPENVTNKTPKFEVADPRILSVDGHGKIEPIKEGVTTVRAITSNGKEDSVEVTIFEIYPQKIIINSKGVCEFEIFGLKCAMAGKKYPLVAKIVPENATYSQIEWKVNGEILETDEEITFAKTGIYELESAAKYEITDTITVLAVSTPVLVMCIVAVLGAATGITLLVVYKKRQKNARK